MEKNEKQAVNVDDEDRFHQFMFGPRRMQNAAEKEEKIQSKNEGEQIDYMLLMENIDNLLASAKQLKPLINKITPFFNQFIQKK